MNLFVPINSILGLFIFWIGIKYFHQRFNLFIMGLGLLEMAIVFLLDSFLTSAVTSLVMSYLFFLVGFLGVVVTIISLIIKAHQETILSDYLNVTGQGIVAILICLWFTYTKINLAQIILAIVVVGIFIVHYFLYKTRWLKKWKN